MFMISIRFVTYRKRNCRLTCSILRCTAGRSSVRMKKTYRKVFRQCSLNNQALWTTVGLYRTRITLSSIDITTFWQTNICQSQFSHDCNLSAIHVHRGYTARIYMTVSKDPQRLHSFTVCLSSYIFIFYASFKANKG